MPSRVHAASLLRMGLPALGSFETKAKHFLPSCPATVRPIRTQAPWYAELIRSCIPGGRSRVEVRDDQIVHPIQKGGTSEMKVSAEVPVHFQFIAADPFRRQGRVLGVAVAAHIVFFITIGSPESLIENRFEACLIVGCVNKTQPRTEGIPELLVPVAPQSSNQDQILSDRKSILKIISDVLRSRVIIQIENVRLKIVVRLVLFEIVAKFCPERHSVDDCEVRREASNSKSDHVPVARSIFCVNGGMPISA